MFGLWPVALAAAAFGDGTLIVSDQMENYFPHRGLQPGQCICDRRHHNRGQIGQRARIAKSNQRRGLDRKPIRGLLRKGSESVSSRTRNIQCDPAVLRLPTKEVSGFFFLLVGAIPFLMCSRSRKQKSRPNKSGGSQFQRLCFGTVCSAHRAAIAQGTAASSGPVCRSRIESARS